MAHRFDDLTKALANARSRRSMLKLMSAGALGSLFTGVFASGASAHRLSLTLCSFGCAAVGPSHYQECVSNCSECTRDGRSPGMISASGAPQFICCPEGSVFHRSSGTCEPKFEACFRVCAEVPGISHAEYSDCLDECRGCHASGLQPGWHVTNETIQYFCCPQGSVFNPTFEGCEPITD